MNSFPKSRDSEIVIQESGSELLIYDLTNHKIHRLNETSAAVWRNCDGKTSVSEIAQGRRLPEEFVAIAIDELQKANLMAERISLGISNDHLSRRRMLIRAGATAIALPLITSLIVPKATHAQSGTCLEPCGSFDLNPNPFFTDVQACVDALITSAQTTCCSGVLNPQSGFIFGTDPELCRGFCGTIQGNCVSG